MGGQLEQDWSDATTVARVWFYSIIDYSNYSPLHCFQVIRGVSAKEIVLNGKMRTHEHKHEHEFAERAIIVSKNAERHHRFERVRRRSKEHK